MICLFCCKPERNYRPGTNVNFICGTCVQLLLSADQADLKKAYAKVAKKGCSGKASACRFKGRREPNRKMAISIYPDLYLN